MGYNPTCMLSDIGIESGDKVACLVLADANYSKNSNRNWSPISPLLFGTMESYGAVKLANLPTAFLKHIEPWIVPIPAGDNSVHEQAVDPSELSWAQLENWDIEDRLLLYPTDEDQPKKSSAKRYGPFWTIFKALDKAGLSPTRDITTGTEACYLQDVRDTGLFVIKLGWGVKKDDPIIVKIQEVLSKIGYTGHLIPAPGIGYESGTPRKDYQVSLLVAPSPGTDIHLSLEAPRKTKPIHAGRGFIRMDVLDALFPIDDKMIHRAKMLQELHFEFLSFSSKLPEKGYAFANEMKRMGDYRKSEDLWFDTEGSSADYLHIAPQILDVPVGSPIADFVPWVCLSDIIRATRNEMRRGLRPTVQYVGTSDIFSERSAQLKQHKKLIKILTDLRKKKS